MRKETCVKGLAIMISFAIAIQCGVYIAYNSKLRFQPAQLEYISRVFSNSTWSNTSAWQVVPFRTNKTTTLTNTTKSGPLPICPLMPPNLVGSLKVLTEDLSFDEIAKTVVPLQDSRYKPPDCISRSRMALIIPFRDREAHLKIFLQNILPMLMRQQIDFGIYIVELVANTRFNRAMLMNIGFAEASKIYDYECFIFHDVDLIPEDDRNLYTCPEQPRHMSVAIDKMNYKLPYTDIFGGACALTKEQFIAANGFSNKFFRWGGEDDDMHNRIKKAGYNIIRYGTDIARYKMLKHKQDDINPDRMQLLNNGLKRMKTDGVNSLKYKLLKLEFRPLYTWVLVDINEKEIMAS